MMLSVIIPTCNRNDLLSQCLDQIIINTQSPGVGYEVIITDDSKTDDAKSLITEKYPWAKWVNGPKKGPAANRNNGAKQASGEWLVFLDDDCLPQKNWLASYIEAIQSAKTNFVFEGSTNADRPKQRFDEEAPINIDGNKLWSCNFAINRSFFLQLKGFDELFPGAAMEDVDFYTRVVRQTQILFVPKALVIHPWRKIKPFKNFKKHLNSHSYFAKKYNLKGTINFRVERAKIFIGSIYFDFRSLLKFSLKGWPLYFEKCIFNFCMIFI